MNKPTPKLIVQKYGGATLATPEKIKQAARRISEHYKAGTKIVVVVSAMGQTTNELIALAHQVSSRPQLRELDMLLTVGERISMSLLSMALNDLACPAISFTGSQAGILTDESHVNANIIDIKAIRVEEALKENKVVILAGFQGVSPITKEITTLGRGGSDTSAVAMAAYLKADRCEILKDVDCVYSADPKLVLEAKEISQLNYAHLLEMTSWGAKVLHFRSVEMAKSKNVKLFVGPASKENTSGTLITSDFQFPVKKIIAINSFNQVFEVAFNESYAHFNHFLTKNQIAQPQFLFEKNKNYFIAGPSETMKQIADFEENQKNFKILNKKYASVSVTYSQNTTDEDLNQIIKFLADKKIQTLHLFNLINSIHLLIPENLRVQAIQALHTLTL